MYQKFQTNNVLIITDNKSMKHLYEVGDIVVIQKYFGKDQDGREVYQVRQVGNNMEFIIYGDHMEFIADPLIAVFVVLNEMIFGCNPYTFQIMTRLKEIARGLKNEREK